MPLFVEEVVLLLTGGHCTKHDESTQWMSKPRSEEQSNLQINQTMRLLSKVHGDGSARLLSRMYDIGKAVVGVGEEEEEPAVGEGAPNAFLCPITRALMADPVIASDGHTYERQAIEEWLEQPFPRSPMTNQQLLSTVLTSNHVLRSQVR